MINRARRWINELRRERLTRRPAPGRLLVPRVSDTIRDYPSASLSPRQLGLIFREADSGSPGRAMQLFDEMEEKDGHLHAVATKRRLALTGLEWSVCSAAERIEGVDGALAGEAAAYCGEVLAGLDAFDDVLQHLSMAIGRNIAMAELIWDRANGELTLADIAAVDFGRIIFDDLDRPRVLTREQSTEGIEPPPNKFIVYTPHNVSGHPFRGGLLRVTAFAFIAKQMAMKDWTIFVELFGMPVRVARYDPSTTAEERQQVLHMLQSLGSNATGMFSRSVEIQFVEAGQGKAPPPYEKIVDFLNREMSKAWLGQTLTTETPGLGGSFGATKIHEEVRKDLRADDLRKEARTLRRDLLGPLARLKFGPQAPVPYFQRKLDRPRNLQELTAVLEAAANRLGVRVPLRWAHEALGIPMAGEGEAVLTGSQPAEGRAGRAELQSGIGRDRAGQARRRSGRRPRDNEMRGE